MLEFAQSQVILYLTIALTLFVPGYFMLLAFFDKEKLSLLERFIISSGLSILILDFLMLFLFRIGIIFTKTSLILTLIIFSFCCFAVYKKRFEKSLEATKRNFFLTFSSKQLLLIGLFIFLAIFLRTAYLQNSLPPSSTDLAHHMYWSKLFSETGKIQDYTQSDIIKENEIYQIASPRPISDFVIGEHLIFSAINLISGASFFSAFPVLIIFFINIFGLLAIFILSLQLFKEHPQNSNIAIFTLFFSGALFAIDPPQAKYIGGGLIGNMLGNLIIPLTFYFYIRYLREKEVILLFFALFFSMGLFYTHHLSGLIFLLTFAGFIIFSVLFNFKETKNIILGQKKILLSPLLFSFLIFALIFVSIIYTPTYLKNSAVNTVVGTIKKVEHTGLSLLQFRNILGEARFAFGFLGFFLLLFFYKKSVFKYSFLLLISWTTVIMLISLAPNLVKISIPSSRVANYGVYPLVLLSSFAIVSVFKKNVAEKDLTSSLTKKLILSAFLLLLAFTFLSGFDGSVFYLKQNNNNSNTQQTYAVGEYLSSRVNADDLLASDHIYLFADSWIKLFFMRDYYFPSFRANFERYENGIDKDEFCTRDMISNPGGELGKKCFSDLGTNFVMVDKTMDSTQFQKLNNFWQVYSNNEINVYYRKK
jgi:hypothetical protein